MNKERKYTKATIKNSIELILSGENIKNRSLNKDMNIVNQQNFYINAVKEKLYSSSLNCQEIYHQLNMFDDEIIPLIIATVIRDNINYIVIEKSGEEQPITYKTFEDIDNNPHLYTVSYIGEHKKFDGYRDIFKFEDKSTNMFYNIVDEMQMWFFNLSKYTTTSKKEYIGKGEYRNISKNIIKFKDSLRGIQNNPFYYLNGKLSEIFEDNEVNHLREAKGFIDNTLSKLKNTLNNDISYVFPETIDVVRITGLEPALAQLLLRGEI